MRFFILGRRYARRQRAIRNTIGILAIAQKIATIRPGRMSYSRATQRRTRRARTKPLIATRGGTIIGRRTIRMSRRRPGTKARSQGTIFFALGIINIFFHLLFLLDIDEEQVSK